jgi:predicted signal transduction protein with EAL and GGDEF domain
MPIIRLLMLVITSSMTVITLVTLMLGVTWLAVAVPVLLIIGVIAVGRMLWRRFGRLPGTPNEGRGPEND